MATATSTTQQNYEPGKEYFYPADELLLPVPGDPLFNSARTNSNEGVDKLEASMKSYGGWGTIPAIGVVDNGYGQFKVVYGIRRTKAARKQAIEAKIHVLDPATPVSEQLALTIQENENRTDTNPLTKAESFGSFVQAFVDESIRQEYPATEENAGVVVIPPAATKRARAQAIAILAANVKLNKNTVDEYLKLLNLGNRARKLIIEGTLKRVDVSDRGLNLTGMVIEDGSPDVAAQDIALDNFLKTVEVEGKKPARKDLKKAATAEAIGYKPNNWEIKQIVASDDTPEDAKNLIAFLKGELTLLAAKRRMPWLKTAFVLKAGPGSVED